MTIRTIRKTVCAALSTIGVALVAAMPRPGIAATACSDSASSACYFTFEPPGAGGRLDYFAAPASENAAPGTALIAVHGHPRDANRTFDAALRAARRAGAADGMLIVAPVFQVAAADAARCHSAGVPEAAPGDLLWRCDSWEGGDAADNSADFTSFAAMDALVLELHRRWPSLHRVTIAGFSAGAQFVQHYIGFAAVPPDLGLKIRYVIADPGSWLYFDPVRPQPSPAVDAAACGAAGDCPLSLAPVTASCASANDWKYGTDRMPARLGRDAAAARARYVQADIHYLEGALDTGTARGTAYRILDKSCAAMAQGPFRLQRGLGYAQYDRQVLAPDRPHPLVIVPDCAHDVRCVFPADAARAALFDSAAE
ncbi:MAG: hypothetical protein P4M00_09830 [Azospirillaceae bacterium]|nr:hypothetical protein [Azospirillaceae bacterium]